MEFCCGHTRGLHPRLPQLLIWCCDRFMYTKRTLPNVDILSFFSQSLLLFLFLLLPYAQNMMHKIKKTNNNLHTQPAALMVHTSWSYIVFTVVPSRVQLFVKERLYPGLLEVFGFLLHCKRLPLWAGWRHTCRELCTHNHKTTPCSFVKCCAVQFALAGAEARIHFTSVWGKASEVFPNVLSFPRLCSLSKSPDVSAPAQHAAFALQGRAWRRWVASWCTSGHLWAAARDFLLYSIEADSEVRPPRVNWTKLTQAIFKTTTHNKAADFPKTLIKRCAVLCTS